MKLNTEQYVYIKHIDDDILYPFSLSNPIQWDLLRSCINFDTDIIDNKERPYIVDCNKDHFQEIIRYALFYNDKSEEIPIYKNNLNLEPSDIVPECEHFIYKYIEEIENDQKTKRDLFIALMEIANYQGMGILVYKYGYMVSYYMRNLHEPLP